MAKVQKSLLGLRASGPLGADLTLSTHGKQVRAGKRSYPFNPQTTAQVSHRTLFLSGIEFWHTLTDAEKTAYAAINPRIGANPGYLNFMRLWLEGNVPYDRGEGHKVYLPWDYSRIIAGAWTYWSDATSVMAFTFGNSNHNDTDSIAWQDYLDAGIYTLNLFCHPGPESGIADIAIDGVVVASLDCYSAAWLKNTRLIETGIVIATPGVKEITFTINGKNPASTNHWALLGWISLWRTA